MSAISTASEKARFHLQERELAYATGRYMRYPRLSHSFEVEDICGIVRLNYASERPFTTTFHIGEMLEGCDKRWRLRRTRATSSRGTIR